MANFRGDTGRRLEGSPPDHSSLQKQLFELSVDVLIEIFSYLNGEDLLNLRACCKTLFELSYERTLWLNLLRRTCIERGIFLPTFPMKDMSVAQLESAAFSPSRFKQFLRSGNTPLEPLSTQLLEGQWDAGGSPKGEYDPYFEHLCLVPGGRFLVTRNAHVILELWDLGFNADMEIKPQAIASHAFDTILVPLAPEAQVSRDGKALIVMLATKREFLVFEVCPTSSSPAFRTIARLPYDDWERDALCQSIHSSDCIVHSSYSAGQLTVWDFMLDKWAKWDVRHITGRVFDLAVSDHNVIAVGKECISVWKIPPLHQRNCGDDGFIGAQAPLLTIPYDIADIHYRTSAFCASWYSYNPPWTSWSSFDILYDLDEVNERVSLARYVIVPTNSQSDNPLKHRPVLVEQSRVNRFPEDALFNAMTIRSGSNDLFLIWYEGSTLFVYLSPEDKATPVPRSRSIPIAVPGSLSRPYSKVVACPFSGRVCMTNKNTVVIMDHVVSPAHEPVRPSYSKSPAAASQK